MIVVVTDMVVAALVLQSQSHQREKMPSRLMKFSKNLTENRNINEKGRCQTKARLFSSRNVDTEEPLRKYRHQTGRHYQ